MDFRVHVQNPDKLSQTAADALLVVLWGDLKKQRVDAPVAGLLADALAAGDLQAKAGRALYLHRPAGVKAKRLVFAVAADGTRVPISLVHHADFAPDATRPMLLTGYGAYGLPYPVTFSSNRLSLLDRGVSFAIGHIRGGTSA